ncbi:MAG: hypothetical protein NXI24_01465 [bacterium]|nr:hypothetical protein [bacterium]
MTDTPQPLTRTFRTIKTAAGLRASSIALICAALLLLAGNTATAQTTAGQFRLDFPPVPNARYYQIEWFGAEYSPEAGTVANPVLVERFDELPYLKTTTPNLKYFRTRAIGAHDIPGAWSDVFPVPVFVNRQEKQDIFRTVERSDGETERYFTGDSITLSAEDDSGEATIYFSINDSPFQKYSGRIHFEEDGPYVLRYYAIDEVGNKEAMRQARFLVDRHAPVTQLIFGRTLVENNGRIFTGPENTIMLEAADEGSGVAQLRYRIFRNGEARGVFKDYSGPISLSEDVLADEGEATYSIEFYAIDRLKNREATRTLYIRQSNFAVVDDA